MFDSLGNQFSFVLFSLGAVVGVVVLLRVLRQGWRLTAGAGVVVAAAALVIFFALRPGLSDVDSVQAAEVMLQSGKPTMLEFFSNFCTNCLAARPQVDALVNEVQTRHADGSTFYVSIFTPILAATCANVMAFPTPLNSSCSTGAARKSGARMCPPRWRRSMTR